MPGSALPAIGDEIAGKYRVEGVLGQGGMGAVFAARNVLTGKRVAIKWLLPEHAASTSRERLLREAQIAASIDHPNVVDIYDVGEHHGGLFLVMEYLRGRNLADVLAERGRLNPEELIALLVPAMRGVHAAHLAGVVHRDLKPENIILSEADGQIIPKVVDFGVSKAVGAGGVPHSSLTRTGALVGTPHFMALEQVDGTNLIDGRTDVYAFGVLLYRSLTGHFPFDGSSLGEVILKIGTKDPVPMRMLRPELPAELDAIVLRALLRDRSKRFADLEELARSLLPFAPSVRLRDTADTTGRFGLAHALEPRHHSHSGSLPLPRIAPGVSFGGSGAPPANSSNSMLGAAVSVHGVGARPTPIGTTRRSNRTAWAVAGALILGLVGAGLYIWHRDAQQVADLPTHRQVGASQGSNGLPKASADEPKAAAGGALDPAALDPVQGAALEAELAPAQALAPEGAQKTSPAPDGTAIMAREQASQPASTDRIKRARPQPKAQARPDKLIPGDRTKGLSVDEF
ncbi:MAG TPA: serine/threonine-protein kinase [Polyangiales bacterium]